MGTAMTEQKKQNLLLGYLLNRQLSINYYIQDYSLWNLRARHRETATEAEIAHS